MLPGWQEADDTNQHWDREHSVKGCGVNIFDEQFSSKEESGEMQIDPDA
jgi:hypothetical protein